MFIHHFAAVGNAFNGFITFEPYEVEEVLNSLKKSKCTVFCIKRLSGRGSHQSS